jgi:hypothetical protein
MIWVRRSLFQVFSLLLFVSLLGAGISTGANIVFSHPNKIENWLNQSNLYGHFVSQSVTQAVKAAGSSVSQTSVTLSDSAVQQAARSAFTTSLYQQSTNTFLISNYVWLEGKTARPEFTINFTDAKQDFASQVGQFVETHIASLPVCTPQQLLVLSRSSGLDPLNVTCRPATLNAQTEAASVTQKIQSSGDFLNNTIITPNNINPNGLNNKEPYYKKYSEAPKLYTVAVKLPWVYYIVALLSAMIIIPLAKRKRSGLRRVGIVLVLSGIILIVADFFGKTILKRFENRIFNTSVDGQIQQALSSFLSKAEHQLAETYLAIGIAFLVLAIIIFIILRLTKNRRPKIKGIEPPPSGNGIVNRFRSAPHNSAKPQPRPAPPQPIPVTRPPRRKPRLIQ